MSCDHLVEVNIADFALNDFQFKQCQLILENNYCVVKLLKEKLHFRRRLKLIFAVYLNRNYNHNDPCIQGTKKVFNYLMKKVLGTVKLIYEMGLY